MDSYCNMLRYKGIDVFQPFGYDAFGLPAENYAKKVGRTPEDVTEENINAFRKQMQNMNTKYEELAVTTSDEYKKFTQMVFTKLHENGLAYKKNGMVNYCPSCETTLANEQVKIVLSKILIQSTIQKAPRNNNVIGWKIFMIGVLVASANGGVQFQLKVRLIPLILLLTVAFITLSIASIKGLSRFQLIFMLVVKNMHVCI